MLSVMFPSPYYTVKYEDLIVLSVAFCTECNY